MTLRSYQIKKSYFVKINKLWCRHWVNQGSVMLVEVWMYDASKSEGKGQRKHLKMKAAKW